MRRSSRRRSSTSIGMKLTELSSCVRNIKRPTPTMAAETNTTTTENGNSFDFKQ